MKYSLSLLLSCFLFNCSAQTFSHSITNDTVYCSPQSSLDHCYSYLINDNSEVLEIDIIRLSQPTFQNWITAMCVDTICYYAGQDSVRIHVAPNSAAEFRSGYILQNDTTSEVATVVYLIKDINDPNSQLTYTTYGINSATLTSTNYLLSDDQISVFPNPTSDKIDVNTALIIESIGLMDANGRLLAQLGNHTTIDLGQYKNGVYLLKINTDSGYVVKRIIKL